MRSETVTVAHEQNLHILVRWTLAVRIIYKGPPQPGSWNWHGYDLLCGISLSFNELNRKCFSRPLEDWNLMTQIEWMSFEDWRQKFFGFNLLFPLFPSSFLSLSLSLSLNSLMPIPTSLKPRSIPKFHVWQYWYFHYCRSLTLSWRKVTLLYKSGYENFKSASPHVPPSPLTGSEMGKVFSPLTRFSLQISS